MSLLIDADTVLSGITQWLELEQQWGNPIDLDDLQDDYADQEYTSKMKTTFSSLDLKKSTFDSSFLFKTSKPARCPSKKSVNYKDFLEDLNTPRKIKKPFFFISGELLSAASVEEICENIDDIFKSVEQLCSATSTVRFIHPKKKPSIQDVVHCSISTGGLSFDDTAVSTSGGETGDVDRYIDEVFEHLHTTIATLSNATLDESVKETVTTLVRKFTSFLKSPELQSSAGLRKQCGDKFRDLAAFWQSQATGDD